LKTRTYNSWEKTAGLKPHTCTGSEEGRGNGGRHGSEDPPLHDTEKAAGLKPHPYNGWEKGADKGGEKDAGLKPRRYIG
jgi:hypothetical protein